MILLSKPRKRLIWIALLSAGAAAIWFSASLTIRLRKEAIWEAALQQAIYPGAAPPLKERYDSPLEIFYKAGPEAVPFLLRRIEGTKFERWKENHWARIPEFIRRHLKAPDRNIRYSTPLILVRMGEPAKGALPRMKDLVRSDPKEYANVFQAICDLGRGEKDTYDFVVNSGLAQPPLRGQCRSISRFTRSVFGYR
jgi:hypothetical protein